MFWNGFLQGFPHRHGFMLSQKKKKRKARRPYFSSHGSNNKLKPVVWHLTNSSTLRSGWGSSWPTLLISIFASVAWSASGCLCPPAKCPRPSHVSHKQHGSWRSMCATCGTGCPSSLPLPPVFTATFWKWIPQRRWASCFTELCVFQAVFFLVR